MAKNKIDDAHKELYDKLRFQVVDGVQKALLRNSETRAGLAEKMGKTAQFVTNSLNRPPSFVLSTVADFALALGCDVDIVFTPKHK